MDVSIDFDPDNVQILISEMNFTLPVRGHLGLRYSQWFEVKITDYDSTVDLQAHQVEIKDEDSQDPQFIALDYRSSLGKLIFSQVIELLRCKCPRVTMTFNL